MKKGIRIIIILLMLLGIVFSTLNFISINAFTVNGGGGFQGIWDNGECQHFGNVCDIIMDL